ncbi:hypothetical protein LTR37_018428 [Vermiconidia calcicola]|uniref:Uncharacterized protein n=1 Tax=Vermiconidia calcicola TaxID=1690605 RepID=A0ACC3MH32_9PEZI|nr:hypothetical protein LTR37_018428 [Vermiconidia calcicola]
MQKPFRMQRSGAREGCGCFVEIVVPSQTLLLFVSHASPYTTSTITCPLEITYFIAYANTSRLLIISLTLYRRAAQLEKLENKIEHLVNALATTQSQRGYSTDLGHPSPPVSNVSERSSGLQLGFTQNANQAEVLSSLCETMEDTANCTPSSATSNTPALTTASTAGSQSTPQAFECVDYHCLGVSIPEAEILLDRFQRLMAPSMPFIVIPTNATAQQLSADKPVLLLAICVVTCFHDFPQQQVMLKNLMRSLSERILMNNEKSIDILQGILVFVAWYHPHIFHRPQVTNLLHLAIAMITDLGFDRPVQQCGDFKSATTKAVHGPPAVSRVPTLEEHRILLGTFYLTSMLACSFKKIDAMPWTSYMSEALQTIEQATDLDSDLFLVQMVRLQDLINETSASQTPQAPMSMYVKAFKVDLERLQKSDPSKDPHNILLRMQYLTSEILVWELSLNDLQENKATPLRTHLDDLYHLVEAIRTFLDVYFLLPTSSYLTMPFSVFGQFAHVFIVLIKIASLEVDGWDMRALNDRLNFCQTIDEAAERFEASTHSEPDGFRVNNDNFGKWAQRVRWMKQVYENKFMQGNEKAEDRAEAARTLIGAECNHGHHGLNTPATKQQPTPPDDVLSGDFYNYLDENFWQSFAGDFDLGFPDMNVA